MIVESIEIARRPEEVFAYLDQSSGSARSCVGTGPGNWREAHRSLAQQHATERWGCPTLKAAQERIGSITPFGARFRGPYGGRHGRTLVRIGLLAVDVSRFGVVMTADSQPVELLDRETRVLAQAGERRTRNPILIRDAGGFTGFTGFAGTETIGTTTTRDWLTTFGASHADESLSAYASALGDELTQEWRRLALSSILEILISGVEDGEVRFWFVRNRQSLHDDDWTYKPPRTEFCVVDDLDGRYLPRDLHPGQTKEDLLRTRMYSFRQGALLPAAQVFDAFGTILGAIYAHRVDGFDPVASLDDLAYFSRQRMEFLKRLYSDKHGIYKKSPAPLGGDVHVFGVSLDREIRRYPKIRSQAKTLRSASA
jgi:hypothetical protein